MAETFDGALAARCAVREASKAELDWMIRAHYLGRWPGVVVKRFALLLDDLPVGALVFALPPRESNKRYGCRVWELARLWVDDTMPRNTESWFMGRVVRLLRGAPVDLLLSYADPSVGHEGVIYRACNWLPDGRTDDERKTPRFDYAHPVTGKVYSRRGHVPADVAPMRVPRVSKHRYTYDLRR